MGTAGPRLIDEFRAEALARGIAIRGEVEEAGIFGDLEWPPNEAEAGEMWARCENDPAFTITGYSRWLAFARICGEIRYYAAALPVGGMTLSGSGVDLARVAAADAESDYSELAILASVADAVTLTCEYLGGTPLRDVRVPRLPPPWGFPEPEPEPRARGRESMENTVSRLVDEFRAEVLARGVELPGELEINGSFADLDPWPSDGDDVEGVIERCQVDPAFKVTGYSRWVVFARVRDEIRYYAASIPEGAPPWWWTGEDPARVAAVRAEPDYGELAILASVADAVTLTVEYLGGTPLREVRVPRLQPPWGFPEPGPG